MKKWTHKTINFIMPLIIVLSGVNVGFASEDPINYAEKTFSTSQDFAEGTFSNTVNTGPDQVQLDDTRESSGFIWVAVSSKGTIVKIDTDSGKVLGEYKTGPDGEPLDPSRTSVDKNGSVWIANRSGNSVTRVCLPESGLWIDKNRNGKCDTSTGLGDVRAWTNADGADSNGGVSTAEDECIINYVCVSSSDIRHVSVDSNNDVWVSGLETRAFDLIDGSTGRIKRTEGPVGYGGFGGLVDKNGVLWSSSPFLRWDTTRSLSGENGTNWTGSDVPSYGLALDPYGNVWTSSYGEGSIRKYAADGTLIGTYYQGSTRAQGCAADKNGDIWVAHSLNGSTVGHLKNDGTYVGSIQVPAGPTGISVDSKGYIWATCYKAQVAVRIDPGKGPLGQDGVTHVGEVDLKTVTLGGLLYDYSDMTGSIFKEAPGTGTWEAVYDSKIPSAKWGIVDYTVEIMGDGAINITVAASEDGSNFSGSSPVSNGTSANVPNGRYLKITVDFKRALTGESPVLKDVTVRTSKAPVLNPVGSKKATEKKLLQFEVSGYDPEGDTLRYSALNLPEGASFDPATRVFSWTPTHEQLGTFNKVHFEVSDGRQSDSEDITINVNGAPDVSGAHPSISLLWLPDHRMVDIKVLGVTDHDGDAIEIIITRITSDEPTSSMDGTLMYSTDASGVGTDTASLRAERYCRGNGRVYEISFIARDSDGGESVGSVKVICPHDRLHTDTAIADNGQNYDATLQN